MPAKNLRDRCPRCAMQVVVPLSAVAVVYDRDEPELDRYEWTHPGCGLVIKPYTDDLAELFAPYLEARVVRARMRDPEWSDPRRSSNAPPITVADVEALVSALAGPPTPLR